MHINEIDLYYKTRDSLTKIITWPDGEPEMTEFESAFLCGVLRKFKPRKIVEVGIAGGGTSAIISSCMCELGNWFELHSIDYYEDFYRDQSKKTGFICYEVDELLSKKGNSFVHKYWLGNVACSFIEKIGKDIDCIILDTVHSMPGEILDFLTMLPYLKNGCVLILHDLVYNHYEQSSLKQAYSNILLFSVIKGEKYLNIDNNRKMGMPSIGAIIIDDDTRKHIGDIFLSLLVTWRYMPIEEQISLYRDCIEDNYTDDLCGLFDASVELNEASTIVRNQIYEFPFNYLPQNCNIVLYGAGVVGQAFLSQVKKKNGLNIVRWVDADAEKMGIYGIDGIAMLRDMDSSNYDFVVIAVENEKLANEIKINLRKMGIEDKKMIWKNPRFV